MICKAIFRLVLFFTRNSKGRLRHRAFGGSPCVPNRQLIRKRGTAYNKVYGLWCRGATEDVERRRSCVLRSP